MYPRTAVRVLSTVLGAALLVLATAPVASAGPAKPAPAAPSAAGIPTGPVTNAPSGCGSGNLCFWADAYYSDGPGQFSGPNTSWFPYGHGSCASKGISGAVWANCASSIFNNGVNCTAHAYYLTNYGLPRLDITRGTGYSNLALVSRPGGGTWNDNIESNNWC